MLHSDGEFVSHGVFCEFSLIEGENYIPVKNGSLFKLGPKEYICADENAALNIALKAVGKILKIDSLSYIGPKRNI